MERCPTYKPWHNKETNKETGKTYLLSYYSQCLHYYFYIMDKDLGLCYVRVPTWCPFRLQIYFNGNYEGEAGNRYNVRIEGTCIKHSMGKVSIKMYDKFQHVLRIETTTNDVSFFKHYRMVEHKDGSNSYKFTSMKKNIYSLTALMRIMKASNKRYLEFISSIEDKSVGTKRLKKVTQRKEENNRGYKGINFFEERDMELLQVAIRGEFNISGFRNKDLRKHLPEKNTGQISRQLKRLKIHGLIKKAKNSYKYYLTRLGKQVILIVLKIKEMVIIPALNY